MKTFKINGKLAEYEYDFLGFEIYSIKSEIDSESNFYFVKNGKLKGLIEVEAAFIGGLVCISYFAEFNG